MIVLIGKDNTKCLGDDYRVELWQCGVYVATGMGKGDLLVPELHSIVHSYWRMLYP